MLCEVLGEHSLGTLQVAQAPENGAKALAGRQIEHFRLHVRKGALDRNGCLYLLCRIVGLPAHQ